jgi:diguanylate cyclase (GGDEF)-like protein/PAS domain S-box-containing protein
VTLFSLIIFLASIWSLAFYASRILHQDIQGLLGVQQASTVSLVTKELDHELNERLQALERVAAGINQAALASPALLQANLDQHPIFQEMFNAGTFITGADGVAIASIPASAERRGVNYLDRDYIRFALKEGKLAIGQPVMGRRVSAPVVAMAAPIFDDHGKVIGALAGVTNLGAPNFVDAMIATPYGQTGGYALLAPKLRMIVTATDKRLIMRSLPAPGINALIDSHLRGDAEMLIGIDPQGIEVLTSVARIPVAGWYVQASLPTEEAFAPIRAMQKRLLLTTLLLTLLAAGLTWWMLKRQLAPILAASKALASVSGKDRWQPLPIDRQDEVGGLIGGFNRLLVKLGQREALLRQILNTSSVAIFLVDLQGRITLTNNRMAEMFGCPMKALVGMEYVELVNPAEREGARQKMLALLASAVPSVDLDRMYWRADRSEFWGHLSGKRFVDAEGQEQGLIGVISDITERKRIEEKLAQHDNMLTAIIDNFPGGISMVDTDLHLIACNKQMKRLLDFPDSVFEKSAPSLEDLFRFNAQRGEYGPGDIEQQVAERVARARDFQPHKFERERPNGKVLEIQGEPVPGGGFVTIYLDITERRQMEEQVRQLAFYDTLTKLPNRRLLYDRLSQSIAASKRSACYGALMFLDLDNFKSLNDTHGHGAGDLLLIEAANRLQHCVRKIDTVARLGGDEFVVVVGDLNQDKAESSLQAKTIAQKISGALAEPYRLALSPDEQTATVVEHRCSASIGVVVFIENEGSQDDFLKWADAAMYRAKAEGRSLIRFWELKV